MDLIYVITTSLIIIIVALIIDILLLYKKIYAMRARRRRALDIGDEAWRLIMKQSHGKSHTSKLVKQILTSNKEKSHGKSL